MDVQANTAADAFRAFWRTGDLASWLDALADDVKLRSPIFTATFDGRAEALPLYRTLFDTLTDVEVGEEFRSESGLTAIPWQANAGSRSIEGIDLLRLDADGRICEVRVMIRTLVGIAAFSTAVGPALARKYGVLRSLLARALTMSLSVLFRAVDRTAPRLVKTGRGRT